mgnify:CR=1 FL=1
MARIISVPNADSITFTDETGKIQATNVKDALTELAAFHSPKYGVTGVGGITVDLTRLWDSVGKTAEVGTDTQTAVNNFDGLAPFNRRKCVGDWSTVSGKPVFTVQSYFGDPDFAEDGTKGNYVAVEIDPLWYYQDDFSQSNINSIAGVIGVSAYQIYGWKPHPICLNADGTIRAKTYLPCYSLALKDGVAVSLPGYQNEWGSYYSLMDAAKTYNSAAILEPSIVRHYEWLLFTIEYANTNCQAIMASASGMPYVATDTIALEAADTNAVVVTAAIGDKFVIGQTIYLGMNHSTSAAIADLNVITNIQYCLDNGTLDAGGTYRLITFDGTARSVTTATTISSRPWKTGACNTVLTPSGCPSGATAPASATLYPMRYRYRENIWGNQYSTLFDLFAKLIGSDTVEDPNKLDWYYCVDKSYNPANINKPDVTDFATAAFIKLPQTTEHVSGYIKSIAMDSDNPCVITPVVQTGASATQYYSDYAYIVNGTTSVRAVRLGGHPNNGALVGVLIFHASYAPSLASWSYGGGLFIPQWGF